MKQKLIARWRSLNPREQRGLQAAVILLLMALAWIFLLQPAGSLWLKHDARLAQLTQERHQMMQLQMQAQALQKRTPLSRDEAFRTLQALTRQALPSAQIAAHQERVSISFKAVAPAVLASWLQNLRENAQVRVIEAQWQRTPQGTWEGALVLQLPTRGGPS